MATLFAPTTAVRWSKKGKYHLIAKSFPGDDNHPHGSARMACKKWVFNMDHPDVEEVNVFQLKPEDICTNCWPFATGQ